MSDPALSLLHGPCAPWVTDDDIDDTEICRRGSWDSFGATSAEIDALRATATDVVWVMLGRPNIGVCEVTIYPCSRQHSWRWWASGHSLGLDGYGGCAGCGENGAIRLDTPVVDVDEVVVDGSVLSPTEYHLLDGVWLVRSDGSWPGGAVGDDYADFSVTYSFGEVPSQLIKNATIEVIVDLYKTRPGMGTVLPAGTSSASRQGISISVDAEVDRVDRIGMSLPSLAKAVSIYNPLRQPHQSWAWSPDESHHNRTVRTFP
jgi:hypothetical protein